MYTNSGKMKDKEKIVSANHLPLFHLSLEGIKQFIFNAAELQSFAAYKK